MTDQSPQTVTPPPATTPVPASAVPAPAGTGSAPIPPAATVVVDAAKIQETIAKYNIPESVLKKYPDLVELTLKTESMNADERDYWLQIVPIMSDEQLVKFYGILDNEKKQLAKLDAEYQQKIGKMNDKHASEWTEFEAKKKREALQKIEQEQEAAEKAKEEELLKQLGHS